VSSIWAGRPGFDSRKRQEIFLSSTASRLPLGPIESPIVWSPMVVSPGLEVHEREADHSPPSGVEVKNCVAIPPFLEMPSWHNT
jgi:hypothetical protein